VAACWEVENFGAEVDREAFVDVGALDEGHVGVLIRGTANRVTRAGAESELRRDLEGVDVEVFGGGALGIRERGVGDAKVLPMGQSGYRPSARGCLAAFAGQAP